jgi:hypothetical protein
MTVQSASKLHSVPDLNILPQSLVVKDGVEFAAARVNNKPQLAILAPAGSPMLNQFEGTTQDFGEAKLLFGPANPHNIAALRDVFEWLKPQPLGLKTSAGLGDRLGIATPGHVRAIRATNGRIAPIYTQQSIREMARTGRTAQQVMDDATWGVFSEGWHSGFGADADHLKTPADIEVCAAAGFTFYTVDPGEYVNNDAETMNIEALKTALDSLPWSQIQDSVEALRQRYLNQTFAVETYEIKFSEEALLRAAVKYGRVVAHVLMMYRHLGQVMGSRPWELEISVDETESVTTHAEHFYIASELKRLGVQWVSLAPRYVGRFEKGVDYIGDLGEFEADFAVHAAIARQLGPYKLSLHSGSDKFSVYPIAARLTKGVVHLKTAGTSYLEALRTIAALDTAFFRSIYQFALERYTEDRATYHVSAQLDKAPTPESVSDADLAGLLDQFDAREILHVTFGSVLKADNGTRFYNHFMELLNANPEAYATNLEKHFARHLQPFLV